MISSLLHSVFNGAKYDDNDHNPLEIRPRLPHFLNVPFFLCFITTIFDTFLNSLYPILKNLVGKEERQNSRNEVPATLGCQHKQNVDSNRFQEDETQIDASARLVKQDEKEEERNKAEHVPYVGILSNGALQITVDQRR